MNRAGNENENENERQDLIADLVAIVYACTACTACTARLYGQQRAKRATERIAAAVRAGVEEAGADATR
jgi:hypothetical protein